MTYEEVKQLDQTYYMNIFGERTPVLFQSGKGMYLYDDNGNPYLDFFAGIAVNCLGHSHPAYVQALQKQAETLIHTSSLYYIEPQARLAQKLAQFSGYDRAFFCNSGAEANEGAIKLAKMYFYKKGKPEKNEIVTLKNSFHGRTLATVAATGQEKYQKPYRPLQPGFSHVEANDIDALKNAVTDRTCAVMVELIQGESGVHPLDAAFVDAIVSLCKEIGALLIVDEVQTGIGRTGRLFAYEHYGIKPDIVTSAKALGGGVPIGAVLATQEVASAFSPGDHGTTFGGNPFCTNAALCVLNVIEREGLLQNSEQMGAYFREKLEAIKGHHPTISEIRGMGLMLGVGFTRGIAKEINQKLFEAKILCGAVGDDTLRILPPLIVKAEHIDHFVDTLSTILTKIEEA